MIFYTADLHLGYFPILHDTAHPLFQTFIHNTYHLKFG